MSTAHHSQPDQMDWTLAWVALPILLVVLALYLFAARRQARAESPWSKWRTAAFTCGIAILAAALAPPIAEWAHDALTGHMVQHLLIGMFAPLCLVLGAPVTLLLRSVPVGTGRRIAAMLRSQPLHLLSHPVAALVLNIGGMYVLYLTPLFASMLASPLLHTFVNLHFLAAGYLFAWSIAGPDPAPGRPGLTTRLVVLLISIAAHAYLGKVMYAHVLPRGTDFSADEIEAAAELMYYGGDLAELLLAIALFATWYQQRRRYRRREVERTATRNGHPPAPVPHSS